MRVAPEFFGKKERVVPPPPGESSDEKGSVEQGTAI